jgi:hypothetical protein
MAHLGENGRQFVAALRSQQRTSRIADRRRLNEALEVTKQRRITSGQWPRTATFTATWPFGSGAASRSFRPRSIVERVRRDNQGEDSVNQDLE